MTERERAALLLAIDVILAGDGYTPGCERERMRANLREARACLDKARDFVGEAIAMIQAREEDHAF